MGARVAIDPTLPPISDKEGGGAGEIFAHCLKRYFCNLLLVCRALTLTVSAYGTDVSKI